MKYRETSVIVRIYTSGMGLQSFLINGVRSARAKHKVALFQPLTLLDLEVYQKPKATLHRINEAKIVLPLYSIMKDIRKSTMAVFLAELISKVVHPGEQSDALFSFLSQQVVMLNEMETGFSSFHLSFMLQLSRYLGFGIHNASELRAQLVRFGHVGLSTQEAIIIDTLLTSDSHPRISDKSLQRALFNALIAYYRLHCEAVSKMKSMQVLQDLSA